MKRVVEPLISERTVISVILFNTLIIFLDGYTVVDSLAHQTLRTLDLLCVGYFAVEALIKISSWGWRSYWAGGWNRFDFIIVMLSLPALFTSSDYAGVVFLLRLSRVARLLRMFRFVPDLEHMVTGVNRALRASLGLFLGLVLAILVLGLCANILFKRNAAPEYFGDPLASCYTVFTVFTLEGWNEIPLHIQQYTTEHWGQEAGQLWGVWARLFFVATVLGGGLLGLSLANAVFVDQMLADNHSSIEEHIDQLTAEVQRLSALLEGHEPRREA